MIYLKNLFPAENKIERPSRAMWRQIARGLAASQWSVATFAELASTGAAELTMIMQRSAQIEPLPQSRPCLPSLVFIGDAPSDGDVSIGPGGWASAATAREWAGICIIHCAGSEAIDYLVFAVLAVGTGLNLLLVECTSATEDQWCSYLSGGNRKVCRISPLLGAYPMVQKS